MWKTTIIDGHGGTHTFEVEAFNNLSASETDWELALKWANSMNQTVDTYVNNGDEDGDIPTAITRLEWDGARPKLPPR